MTTSKSDLFEAKVREEQDDGLHDNAINEWYAEQPLTHFHAHRHFGGLEHHDQTGEEQPESVDGHRHEHTHPPDYAHG